MKNFILTSFVTSNLRHLAASGDGHACTTTEECLPINDYFECKMIDPNIPNSEKECMHKDLFPMTGKEWVGTFVFSLIMLLSNVAGIGGGGVAIPLAMYFFNLSMKPAVAVSSFSIMASTVARFFYNFGERHPEKEGCVSIDYGMTNVMMPLTLIGSMIGAYFYKSFPDLILIIILTILLLIFTLDSARKYVNMRAKENERDAKLAAENKSAGQVEMVNVNKV